MKKYPVILIISGAVLWGTIGIFIRSLSAAGFTPMDIVFIRAMAASVILFAWLIISRRDLLRVRLRDLWFFAATGILSVAFFNWCYFTAIEEVSVSIAAVLLYTAPAFVIIISRIVFGEMITPDKITAVLLSIAGCSLIAGFIPGSGLSLSARGLLFGLGSGFGYALYPVFAKPAGKRYSSAAITAYTFLFTAVSLMPFCSINVNAHILASPRIMFYSAGLGLFPTVLAYLLYTKGLAHVEAGKAAIFATVEPVVAIFTGMIYFNEKMSPAQIAGSLLIIFSIFITGRKPVKE